LFGPAKKLLVPPEKFPITIEFLHPVTGAVVHTITIEAPSAYELTPVPIPPVAKMVGHPVEARMIFGDGEVIETRLTKRS
jgi:hypothetical protein